MERRKTPDTTQKRARMENMLTLSYTREDLAEMLVEAEGREFDAERKLGYMKAWIRWWKTLDNNDGSATVDMNEIRLALDGKPPPKRCCH